MEEENKKRRGDMLLLMLAGLQPLHWKIP